MRNPISCVSSFWRVKSLPAALAFGCLLTALPCLSSPGGGLKDVATLSEQRRDEDKKTLQLLAAAAKGQTLHAGEALFLTLPAQLQQCRFVQEKQVFTPKPHPSGDKNLALLIVAASLDSKPGPLTWEVSCPQPEGAATTTWTLPVVDPGYPQEQLTVQPGMVKPPESVHTRIARERKEIRAATLTAQMPDEPLQSAFNLPAPLKKVTAPFGVRRLYNGTLKGRHTGVDVRAAEGTSVRAPHAGVVRMAQDNWYTGGHVVLEHGAGVTSAYFHLSRIDVKVGDKVEQGQKIALSGATGRTTGPHLHWGVYVQGTAVNPISFVSDSIRVFARGDQASQEAAGK